MPTAIILALTMLLAFQTAQAADGPLVRQKDKAFHPDRISLKVGASLSVENDDPAIHHLYVDSPTMQFDSGEQLPGTRVSIPFAVPGSFAVRCAIHPRMRLEVEAVP